MPDIHSRKISGMHCKFLPPYSPDYNPVKLAFYTMKYHLRRNGEYICLALSAMSNTEVYCTLLVALYQITMADIFGWYQHCEYV